MPQYINLESYHQLQAPPSYVGLHHYQVLMMVFQIREILIAPE